MNYWQSFILILDPIMLCQWYTQINLLYICKNNLVVCFGWIFLEEKDWLPISLRSAVDAAMKFQVIDVRYGKVFIANRNLSDWVSDFTIFVYINFREQQAQWWAGERCWSGEMASYLTVIACFTTLLTWNIAENTNNVVLVAFFQGKRFSNPQEFNVLLKLKERVVKIIYFLVSTWDSTHIYNYTKRVRNGLFSDIFMLKNVN